LDRWRALISGGAVAVSVASTWEIAIKAGLGRLEVARDSRPRGAELNQRNR